MTGETKPETWGQLATRVIDDLNAHTARIYDDGHRKHLGASQIGDPCARKLWYAFRWCATPDYINDKGENHKGRMMRLFNRGHKEEFRFTEWLRGMGFAIEEFDPASKLYYDECSGDYAVGDNIPPFYPHAAVDVTGDPQHQERAAGQGVKRKQLRISACDGHFGGSIDGIIQFPARYGLLPHMLLEYKTSGEKAFLKLKVEGVRKSKHAHYAQMCVYGAFLGIDRALYLCVNKNTDEIYAEVVEINFNVALNDVYKASAIISAQTPPTKLSENSAYFECKFCDFRNVCHNNAPYEKNCRSCKFSTATANKTWTCSRYGGIPDDFIAKGCDDWEAAR